MLFCVSLSVMVLTLVGFGVLIRAALFAPHALEDERGFHLVAGAQDEPVVVVSPVPVAAPDLAFFHR